MNAMNSYTRPASGLGMPARTRHAVTSDEIDDHGQPGNQGQRFSEQSAESIEGLDQRPGDLQQPFIELSNFESDRNGGHLLQRAVSEASLLVESPVWVGDEEEPPQSPQQQSSAHHSPQQHSMQRSRLLQHSSSVQHEPAGQQEPFQTQGDVNDGFGLWDDTTDPEDVNDDPHTRLL